MSNNPERDDHNYFRQPDKCFCFGGACRRQFCPAKKIKAESVKRPNKVVETIKKDGKTIYICKNGDASGRKD